MRDAFLLRLSPRYSRSGRLRGTLVDPAEAATGNWGADQQIYYRSTVGALIAPAEPVVVEFGQPPVEFIEEPGRCVGSLIVFVMGAESSQGSANQRGLLGVGRVTHVERTNDKVGAAARVMLRMADVILMQSVVTNPQMKESAYFGASGLGEQRMFGWSGASSAQNCYVLHDRSAGTDAERLLPVLATLAIMRDANPVFWSRFQTTYAELARATDELPRPVAGAHTAGDDYIPVDYRSEPIDAAAVAAYVSAKGMIVHPWQVGAFATAVRAKPFVILAGISGTGKTRLPILIAEATASEIEVVAVKPDWTDSSDLLGYTNLAGEFRPGPLLRFASEAMQEPDVQHFFLLDEMNIARPEYYLAEILSAMERLDPDGNSAPLVPSAGVVDHVDYSTVVLPRNLAIVGAVNVDESTYDFSRKVLDRAFVLEYNDVDLLAVGSLSESVSEQHVPYSSAAWRGEPTGLANRSDLSSPLIESTLLELVEINENLLQSRLEIGYRVRDEFVAFVLESQQVGESFTTRDGLPVSPTDIAIAAKILPRVQGSGSRLGGALEALQVTLAGLGYGYSESRVGAMRERLVSDGHTSFF